MTPNTRGQMPHYSSEHSKAHQMPQEPCLEEELYEIIDVGDKGKLISLRQ